MTGKTPIIVPAGDRRAVTAGLESALGGRVSRRLTGTVSGSIAILAAAGGPSTTIAIEPVTEGATAIRTIVRTGEPVGEEALALARALAVDLEQRRNPDGSCEVALTFGLPANGEQPAPAGEEDRLADVDRLSAALATETAEVQRLAAQLSDANGRLREFNRLVAHDLKNPLVVIARSAEILAARPTLENEERGRHIATVEMAARQAVEMIDDILAYSQAGELPARPVKLDMIVGEVIEAMRATIEAAQATVEVRAPLPEVVGNATALRQVLRNLVANALAYRHPDRPPVIAVSADDSAPDHWRIAVADNGIGIPPERREAVFQPGVRLLATDAPGTGYGLTAVRALIERHGGDIHAEDAPGGTGTAMVIDLPRPSSYGSAAP